MSKACIRPQNPSTSDNVIEKRFEVEYEDGLYPQTAASRMGRGSNEVACKLTKFSLNSNLNARNLGFLFPGFAGKGQQEINGFAHLSTCGKYTITKL
jgi:hypothetical protein